MKYNKLDETVLALLQNALDEGLSVRAIARDVLGKESRESSIRGAIARDKLIRGSGKAKQHNAKMLVLDIETAPVLANVWGLFQQNVGLNMIHQDWYVLSYCAKWVGSDEVFYEDKRSSYNTEDDSELLKGIWHLINEADIVIGQNSVRFDTKKLNARFLLNGMPPPSSYRQIDTLHMAKKSFGFTSNKLEYMTDKLCKKYKKLSHGNFAGFELWKQCLAGNPDAWQEMQDYNINDVLSTEELYTILRPWTKNHPNMNLYHNSEEVLCSCGHSEWEHAGYHYTNLSKFDKFRCKHCGAENRGRVNLVPKTKRETLRGNLT